MRSFTVLIFCLAFSSRFCQAQVLLKLSDNVLTGYSLTGGDEFNKPMLDENTWSNGLGWTRVLMSQDLAFSPENVKLEDGVINFIASKKDSTYILNPWEVDSSLLKKTKTTLPGSKFLAKYAAGCIITRQKLHYGLYEVRFKVEQGRGVWPAFWFYGGNKNEEIDAFELKGERNNEVHVDTHCPYGCDRGYKNNFGFNTNWGAWMPVSDYLHNGFNTIQLEWKPEEVIWYINGYPLAYFKGSFSNPMNLYLNTSVAKDGGGFKPGPDESTTWPNNYYVDYLRIWQPAGEQNPLALKRSDAYTTSPRFAGNDARPTKKRGLVYKKKELNPVDGMISLFLSGSNTLKVTVMGKLKEAGPAITIKYNGSAQLIANTGQPQEIQLPPSEKEIEVVIVTKTGTYSQKISIDP